MTIESKVIEQPFALADTATAQQSGDQLILSLDALVRSIGVRRAAPLAMFLGAGASTSSGVPSAQMCIWEWKRQIFLTNNPGLEEQFAELSLDGVRPQDSAVARPARWIPPGKCTRGVRLLYPTVLPDRG
jgi:hypothetical protein